MLDSISGMKWNPSEMEPNEINHSNTNGQGLIQFME